VSKSARDTLFGITLTELVIILFFIMLLLSLNSMEKLSDQIPDDAEDVVPASTVIDLLIPDGEIKSDLMPIEVIAEQIKDLQKDRKELEELKKVATEENDEKGTGDCREGGFWITPKCADNCWAIENPESNRQYDYLLDIGVCKSFIVVQKSEWIKKTESDFMLVQGATSLVKTRTVNNSELYKQLDIIKEPGYLKEPKQCFHNVRLIDLGSGSVDSWTNLVKQVESRFQTFVLTESNNAYRSVRNGFPDDVCAILEEDQGSNSRLEYANKVRSGVDKIVKSNLKPGRVEDQKDDQKLKPKRATFKRASMYSNFGDNLIKHKKCRNIRSSKITLTFEMRINENGDASYVNFKGSKSSLKNSDTKLMNIIKDTLYQTKYIPAQSDGRAVESVITQPVTLPRGVCQ
jgi:hypothetical protein